MTPEELSRIHARAFAPERGWSAEEFGDLLGMPGVLLLVNDRAFLLGRCIAGEGEVLTLATDPAFQRTGLAGRLLGQFIDVATRQRCDRLFLEVAEDNRAARALYQRAGFVQVGLRRGYVSRAGSTPVDALVMELRTGAQEASNR